MTKDPGTATDLDRAARNDPGATGVVPAPAAPVLAVLAVAWLAGMLWSTRAEIHAAAFGSIAITLAANALPVVVSAALVAGVATGLAGGGVLARRAARPGARFAVATATGLVVGLLGALAVTLTFPGGSARMVLAGTTVAAAVIGGAVAGVRVPPAAGGVVGATLAAFVVVLALSRFNDQLLDLFGADDSVLSKVTAGQWVSRLASFAAGLAAGLVAYHYLRWAQRRAATRTPDLPAMRWPVYLVTGAGAGLLLLVTEVVIRIGGGSVLGLAGALSEADSVAQRVLGGSRVDHGITVLFVGALTTLIAFGRTLGPAQHNDDLDADTPTTSTDRRATGVNG